MFINSLIQCKCKVRMMTDESYLGIRYMICPKCGTKIELDVIQLGAKNQDEALVNVKEIVIPKKKELDRRRNI